MVKRSRNRKWIVAVIILILVIIVGAIGILVWNNNQNTSEETDNQNITEDQTEKQENENDVITDEVVDEKKVVQYDGEDPNEANELSGAVTYAGVNDGKLMIRVNIDQYVTNGSCELSLRQSDSVLYNTTARIVGDVTTATCEGFDVPVANLRSGNINISIKLDADNKKGVINGEVNI